MSAARWTSLGREQQRGPSALPGRGHSMEAPMPTPKGIPWTLLRAQRPLPRHQLQPSPSAHALALLPPHIRWPWDLGQELGCKVKSWKQREEAQQRTEIGVRAAAHQPLTVKPQVQPITWTRGHGSPAPLSPTNFLRLEKDPCRGSRPSPLWHLA